MKLYTYCEKDEAKIVCHNKTEGVKLVEYSYQEYLAFIKEVCKYYIHYYHSWYETDMSDRDEGSTSDDYGINYSSLVIKDNKVYGVLVKNSNDFPDYLILVLKNEKVELELGGGYSSNSFDWSLKKHELDDETPNYVLIHELIQVSTDKKTNKKSISIYKRKIISFLEGNQVFEGDKLIGFKYCGYEFKLDDPSTWIYKESGEKEFSSTIEHATHVHTLVKVDKEFLDKEVFDCPYEDFRNKKYKMYTKINLD